MKTACIVIGMGSYNDLGLIRSLGEGEFKEIIYLFHGESLIIPINKSKYLSQWYTLKPNQLINYINDLARNHTDKKFVVFPASDVAVEILDTQYQTLAENVYFSHAQGKLNTLIDKNIMGAEAQKAGLAIPSTKVLELPVADDITAFEYPIILKPVSSIEGEKEDITICNSCIELTNTLQLLANKGYKRVLAQKYLHNKSSKEIGITGVALPNGSIIINGYIHKIRNKFNINNYGIYYPNLEDSITRALQRYIKQTGYQGIFDSDFIELDNKLYFIECNFRNGAYGYAVTHAGFNMPKIYADYVTRQKFKNNFKVSRCKFMEERTDILNILDRSMNPAKWIYQFLTCNTLLWGNRRDSKPFIYHLFGKILAKFH